MAESLEVVSVEQDGRVLSGVGVDADRLSETMERHAPAETLETPAASSTAPPVASESPSQTDQRPTRGSRRFSALEHERDEAAKRADAAEARAKDLESKLTAGAPRHETVTAPAVAVNAVQPPAATRTKPSEDQVGSKYQTYADFVEDLADWKAEQRLASFDFDARIRPTIEADRVAQRHAAKVDEVISRGRKTYPDFDAVLQAPHMLTAWPADKIAVIASLEKPETIQYALAKDPALAEALRVEANPAQFGLRLAQLITAAAVASPASTAPTSSVLPVPYQPVGSGSKTTVTPSAELATRGHDFDKSGYREKRAAERGVFRKVK